MSTPGDFQRASSLCQPDQLRAARGVGRLEPESLRTAGFVHLSTPQQVHLPANRLFAGRADTLLLFIDPARLAAPLRWEAGLPEDPPDMRFPHLYGPLALDAVTRVACYLPLADGRYAPLSPAGTSSTGSLHDYRET